MNRGTPRSCVGPESVTLPWSSARFATPVGSQIGQRPLRDRQRYVGWARARPSAGPGRSEDTHTARARSGCSRRRPPRRGTVSTASATGRRRTKLPRSPAPYRWRLCPSTASLGGSEVRTLRLLALFIRRGGCLGGLERGHFTDRDVPPGLTVRTGDQRIGCDVNRDRAARLLRGLNRLLKFGPAVDLDHVETEAAHVRRQVDREVVPVEPAVAGALAVRRAEPLGAE